MVVFEHDNAKPVAASKLICFNNKNMLKQFEFPREATAAEMLLLNSLTIPKLHGTIETIERKIPIS